MMPIMDFLSCTHVLDGFESLSPKQRHHAKTYVTGLVATSNKIVAGIAREVLLAKGKRAFNKFLTEYDWDKDQFNHERLDELGSGSGGSHSVFTQRYRGCAPGGAYAINGERN